MPKLVKKKAREVVGLENVKLYREERLVLDDVSLSIKRGQHWILLGPNGSGKSSLLAVLQGLLWPIEGVVRVLGRRYGETDLSEIRRVIGWVGNDIEPEFPKWQTVEDIALSGSVGTIGMLFDKPSEADRKLCRRILKRAGILHLAKRPFAFLSQGQRRLATIARALLVKPGLLILDEPAAGLDPVARETFLASLAALMREKSGAESPESGPVILYVTHHVEEALPEFTHAMLLRQGRISAQGPMEGCLTAENLGEVFGRKVRLGRSEGRYWLRLA